VLVTVPVSCDYIQPIPADKGKAGLNLTDSAIRKSKPAEMAYKQSEQHDLFLLVKSNRSRLWQYVDRYGGRQRLLSLGQYPVVSLAAAREKHMEARRQLEEGVDPAAQKQADKQGSTFGDVALRWLKHWRSGVAERHAGMVERRMRADKAAALVPAPVKFTERASALRLAELEAWATERIAASRSMATASATPAKPVLRDPRQLSSIASEELAG
jgi:Arm DNA-binding domain